MIESLLLLLCVDDLMTEREQLVGAVLCASCTGARRRMKRCEYGFVSLIVSILSTIHTLTPSLSLVRPLQEIERLKETIVESRKLVFAATNTILEILHLSLRKADHDVLSTSFDALVLRAHTPSLTHSHNCAFAHDHQRRSS